MVDDRVRVLRERFDQAFAEAPAPPEAPFHDYLKICVGAEVYAVALLEIASLHSNVHVVPMPTPALELLGVAAIRATLVPIYDLRVALGMAAGPDPRWSMLIRGGAAVFAFDGFDGLARSHDRGATISLDGRVHAVISPTALLDAIRGRWMNKEQAR